jgi:hypothetical protein
MIIVIVIIAPAVVLAGCTSGNDTGTAAKPPASSAGAYEIIIVGSSGPRVTVALSDLKAMASVRKDVYYCDICTRTNVTTPYFGPAATAVLAKAGLPPGDYSLRVSGAGGISVNYTREQVENSIIALRKNQTELTGTAESGIVFVYAGSNSFGWVPLPSRIEIMPANP